MTGDVSSGKGDGYDARYNKKYSLQLKEYANQSLTESELNVYREIFGELVTKNNITEIQDFMLTDLICFDFIRAKRLQLYLKEHGDVFEIITRGGHKFSKVNEASYLLNAVEGQMRQNMRELLLTRKESLKKKIAGGHFDFAKMIVDGEVVDCDDSKEHTE